MEVPLQNVPESVLVTCNTRQIPVGVPTGEAELCCSPVKTLGGSAVCIGVHSFDDSSPRDCSTVGNTKSPR